MKNLLILLFLFTANIYAQVPEFEGEVIIRDYMLSVADTTPIMPFTGASQPGYNDIYAHACQLNDVRGSCVLRFQGLTDVQVGELSYQARKYFILEFYQPLPSFSGEVSYVWEINSSGSVMDELFYEYLDHYGARCTVSFERQDLFGVFIQIATGPCTSTEVPTKEIVTVPPSALNEPIQ